MMNRIIKSISIVVFLIFSMCSFSEQNDEIPLNEVKFAETQGGIGGKIIRMTNLDPDGKGSLREALETRGARIIVFEVGGVIDLNKNSLRITKPFVTIAGQTAPSPGITIIQGSLGIRTHDVVVKHIRVRPGERCL